LAIRFNETRRIQVQISGLLKSLIALFSISLLACGGGDDGDNNNTPQEDTTSAVDEGGSTTSGWSDIETIFSTCTGCHTGGTCTGVNCFLNDYESAVSAPSGPNCTGHTTSIECGLARAKDGSMPLGGCAQAPCIPDAAAVEAWIADGMPE
jgi:hypothetical protein